MGEKVWNTLWTSPIVPLIGMILSTVAGLCPVARRRNFRGNLLRILGALGIFIGFILLRALTVDTSNASTTLEPLYCFLSGFLLGWLVLRMRAAESVFVAVWAQILTELFTQLLIPTMNGIIGTDSVLGKAFHLFWIAAACALLFLAVRLFLFRHLTHNGTYRMNRKKTVLSLGLLIIFLILSNYQVIFWLLGEGGVRSGAIIPVFRMVVGVSALLFLYLLNATELRLDAQRELDMAKQMELQREEQYRISKENIALINQKCHDLKHQIAALRTLRDQSEFDRQITEMENAVMIYDSAVKTGNSALDVVLTEKSLFCEAHGVNMTCLIDGNGLGFVEIVDLYSMFGNALDNAIESVMKEKDRTKRVIQVAGYREKGFFLIRVRNYCETPPALIDGLPATTKENNGFHGFGIKSIRSTAEKYGGEISIETGDHSFTLQILLPMPSET